MKDKGFSNVFVQCKKVRKSYQMEKDCAICPACGESVCDDRHALFSKKTKWGKSSDTN